MTTDDNNDAACADAIAVVAKSSATVAACQGTRIKVYGVFDYHKTGWHRDTTAETLSLSSLQVELFLADLRRGPRPADQRRPGVVTTAWE